MPIYPSTGNNGGHYCSLWCVHYMHCQPQQLDTVNPMAATIRLGLFVGLIVCKCLSFWRRMPRSTSRSDRLKRRALFSGSPDGGKPFEVPRVTLAAQRLGEALPLVVPLNDQAIVDAM